MQIKFKDRVINLPAKALNPGMDAPAIELVKTDLSLVNIGGIREKTQLIITALSVDTPVCGATARRFESMAARLDNTDLYFISCDLPFALARFASTDDISRLTMLSDYRDRAFGEAFGVLVKERPITNLLARAVFVIAPNGKITYIEIVDEIMSEPNYEIAIFAAENAAREAANDESETETED
ncbi:MAG: thiol peroxidase [Helicobacteraceae bacterium]|jgi:thiol peroxidase|nr:thiol peroxidase [Helicobacteraceae bacterium]